MDKKYTNRELALGLASAYIMAVDPEVDQQQVKLLLDGAEAIGQFFDNIDSMARSLESIATSLTRTVNK